MRAFETLWPTKTTSPARWWWKKSKHVREQRKVQQNLTHAGKDHVFNINLYVKLMITFILTYIESENKVV